MYMPFNSRARSAFYVQLRLTDLSVCDFSPVVLYEPQPSPSVMKLITS
jgi:hypothetical protein